MDICSVHHLLTWRIHEALSCCNYPALILQLSFSSRDPITFVFLSRFPLRIRLLHSLLSGLHSLAWSPCYDMRLSINTKPSRLIRRRILMTLPLSSTKLNINLNSWRKGSKLLVIFVIFYYEKICIFIYLFLNLKRFFSSWECFVSMCNGR